VAYADPETNPYTWNTAQREDELSFAAGTLSLYFGKASEYQELLARNPNFEIGIAPVPQLGAPNVNYADVYGVAVTNTSKQSNPQYRERVFAAAYGFLNPQVIKSLDESTSLPSIRRDTFAENPYFAYSQILNASALTARTWYDPHEVQSDAMFDQMIEDVQSGRITTSRAVSEFVNRLKALVR
jgi:ABC-type glycerol-3-phosphate transport system substrate-binding protein